MMFCMGKEVSRMLNGLATFADAFFDIVGGFFVSILFFLFGR